MTRLYHAYVACAEEEGFSVNELVAEDIFMKNIYEYNLLRELKNEKGELIFTVTDIKERFFNLAFRDGDIRALTFWFEMCIDDPFSFSSLIYCLKKSRLGLF